MFHRLNTLGFPRITLIPANLLAQISVIRGKQQKPKVIDRRLSPLKNNSTPTIS